MKWLNVLRYIGLVLVIYLCGAMVYLWLGDEGTVPQKLLTFAEIVVLIAILTVDFWDGIGKWFKKRI